MAGHEVTSQKVLLLEDDPMQLRLIEASLTARGFEVETYADGEAAWARLQEADSPQLLVLDVGTPGLDGLEVCRRVREDAVNDRYRYMVMLTARDLRGDRLGGLAAGADDYVVKPADPEELDARLRVGQRIVKLERQLVASREALQALARTDALTGIANRRAGNDALVSAHARAVRDGSQLAVLLIDIDFFKQVNDTYGHPAGDTVLREVAKRFGACLRPYDVLARYGGEEFLVALPGATPADALFIAERLRESVAATPFDIDGRLISVSVSGGLIDHCAIAPQVERVLQSADAALYESKHAGRNRITYRSFLAPDRRAWPQLSSRTQ